MKLSREVWLQVEPLISEALELQPAARAAWLAALEATHPAAARVLQRMLESHDRAKRQIDENALEIDQAIARLPGA